GETVSHCPRCLTSDHRGHLGSRDGECVRRAQAPPELSSPVPRIRCAELARLWLNPIMSIVRHGLSPEGKQRYRCRSCLEGRGRTFLLEYSYAGQSPAVKQQIVDMAMNASGIRDTARVLHVSPTTVLKELK